MMPSMAERKLKAWQAAGIIDGATAQRIRAYEAANSRPVALWAVVGVAALAIGLGVISVVAANWDAIPGETRLALHGALLVGLALGARGPALVQDAVVFLFALLGLAFFGHLGQVYQTASPTWVALGLWLALFGPALLALGRGWLTAGLLVAGSVAVPWFRVDDPALGEALTRHGPGLIRAAAECTAPVWLLPLALWGQSTGHRRAFWGPVGQLALGYAVGAVSLLVLGGALGDWARSDPGGYGRTATLAIALILGAAGLVAAWRKRDAEGEARAAVLGLLALATLATYPLSGGAMAVGLLFLALWSGIAVATLHAGRRSLFQLAVAVIALRLIVLSFEEAGGLLASGVGLIAGGVITLAIAWAALQITRRFAPAKGGLA